MSVRRIRHTDVKEMAVYAESRRSHFFEHSATKFLTISILSNNQRVRPRPLWRLFWSQTVPIALKFPIICWLTLLVEIEAECQNQCSTAVAL